MNTETSLALAPSFPQHQSDHHLHQRGPKRKFDSLLRFTWQEASGYPSPPMSTPPSPPVLPRETTLATSNESTSITATSAIVPLPGLPATLPRTQFTAPPPPPPPAPSQYLHPFQGQVPGPPVPSASLPGFFQFGGIVTSSPNVNIGSNVPGPVAARSGRKSRGHVASACINCKKAHLSCDVQRPCSRCVASGKHVRLRHEYSMRSELTTDQDTCVDVQHKKRGRPRLREETEFKVEQMMPSPATQPTATMAPSPQSTRPIAGTRHRRTESLRSLRSQTSDSSGPSTLPTPTFPPPPSTTPRFRQQPSGFPSSSLGTLEVPTAYLDLDLTFIRANSGFQNAMSAGQDVRGRRLDEIASSADATNFQSIRNQLREEREAREPSYMPPIVHQSQDPLQGVSDADVDRLAQGFTDRTYIWTQSQPTLSRERFTVRVRLAKTNTYFVVVTLPPVRQLRPAQPATLSSPYAMPATTATHSYQPYGSAMPYSTSPGYYSIQSSPLGAPLQLQPSPGPPPLSSPYPTYPPPPPQMMPPYQHLPPPVTPRMGTGAPSERMQFTPPTGSREAMPPSQEPLLLPPIVSAPGGALLAPSISAPPESQRRRSSSEEEGDDERSPKKRRRVGIHDVLQQ